MDLGMALPDVRGEVTLAGDIPWDGGVGWRRGGGCEVMVCGRIDFMADVEPARRGALCRLFIARWTADGCDWPGGA